MGARDYSVTAASNLSVQGISLAEGMARSSVNNAQRAQLADIAELLLDLGGATTTTGSGNAYLLALDTTPTALADNLLFLATSHHTNTSSSTLNLSGLGVKDIKKLAAGTTVSLGAQDFPAGHVGIFTYSSTNNCFLMLNPGTALLVGAETAIFETRTNAASAATAGTIPASIDVIEVLGREHPGDDPVVSYLRKVSAPTVGDSFLDVDGTWWAERAQGLQRVDGMAALRTYEPIDGRSVYLSYHTTIGDLGGGIFRAVTGDPVGYNVDNDGTIIVQTGGNGSKAWLRVWDGVTAHVAWFGATCDGVTDDYAAVKKCLDLFTNGRSAIRTGAIDVGPGFAFGMPLVYGGSVDRSLHIFGHQSIARGGTEASLLKYIGPATAAAIIFYGANESFLEDVNTWPGNAYNGVVVTADNTYNATLSAPVTAGTNVIATPSNMTWLQGGCFLGVGTGGGFEVVYVSSVTATTFTATFTQNHGAGAQLGNSAGSSGVVFRRCRLMCPDSPVWTTLSADTPAGTGAVFTPASMTGIALSMPIRIGSFMDSEIVYPTSLGGSTFTANSVQNHVAGDRVMYATSAVFIGNRIVGTVQVSEMTFTEVTLVAFGTKSYAGIRQMYSGNVKNISCFNMRCTYLMVPFAFEASSGQYLIDGCVTGGITDTIIINSSATITVIGLEDESAAMLLRGGSGANPIQATFVGCTIQSGMPVGSYDQLVVYAGALTFIGCGLNNYRTGASYPIFTVPGIRYDTTSTSLTLINSYVGNTTATTNFIQDVPLPGGGGVDVMADGTGKLTMLGCTGGVGGALTRLPTILPPTSRWQNTVAGVDPASLAAGAVSSVNTTAVTGVVLGDLVEASFSLDLQGVQINAWVSAPDVVSYQFYNPRGGVIDLAAGDVKLRVRK